MRLMWDINAWEDCLWWQTQDRKILRRINQLLGDVLRTGNDGIGKPQPLRYDFAGYWSRRITEEHRLVTDQCSSPQCRRGRSHSTSAHGGQTKEFERSTNPVRSAVLVLVLRHVAPPPRRVRPWLADALPVPAFGWQP